MDASSALPFLILFYVMGGLYILFGLIKPPSFLEHFFRVPSIFVFLPSKYVIRVGRIVTGLFLVGFAFYFHFYIFTS